MDLFKRPLIVFGEDWGAHPSSTQHLVKRLAAKRDVVWVNSIGLRRPRFNAADLSRLGSKLVAMGAGAPPPAPRPEGMTVVSPWAVSWPGAALASAMNARLLTARLSPHLRRFDAAPILWCSLPTAVDVVGRLGEAGVVYYAGDDFAALENVDHRGVLRAERGLLERVDRAYAASAAIAATLMKRAPGLDASRLRVIDHGCDVDLFGAPPPPAADLPAGGKVAGFYGSLSGWIDLELLAAAAQRLTDWTFVLIGPVRTDIRAIAKRGNIRVLGPRPHAALPAYVGHWRASLLPFRDTAQIRASNPLKLREYLAAGAPVVATAPTPLFGYDDHVAKVDGPDELCAALVACLHEDKSARTARKAAVAEASWDSRAARLDRELDFIKPLERLASAA